MFKNIFTILFMYFLVSISGLKSDSSCKINGISGKCLPARECLAAQESYRKNGTLPVICSHGQDLTVCCATDNATKYVTASTLRPSDDCEPLTSVTASEVGQKSWNKCLEYQEKIMRPCKDILFVEGKFRISECYRDTLALILENGVLEDELPHMVLLGYGDDMNSLRWLCEGVIISERFILMPASCSFSHQFGPVQYIRTGVLNVSDPVDSSRLFKVKRTIKHPLFKPPKPDYNIALLEIDTEIPLGLSALPACLDVGTLPSYTHAVALGWKRHDMEHSLLQKRRMYEAASSEVCVGPGDRHLYNETTQMCYDNKYDNINDYGYEHVLQIEHIKCMYVVIGLEFRHSSNYKGIRFTRVSPFIPWIENIVWR